MNDEYSCIDIACVEEGQTLSRKWAFTFSRRRSPFRAPYVTPIPKSPTSHPVATVRKRQPPDPPRPRKWETSHIPRTSERCCRLPPRAPQRVGCRGPLWPSFLCAFLSEALNTSKRMNKGTIIPGSSDPYIPWYRIREPIAITITNGTPIVTEVILRVREAVRTVWA